MPSNVKKSPNTRVILVRHGESTYNALGLYQGSSNNSVLTTNGLIDARRTGNYLKALSSENKNFDVIYSSPLKRAYDTAKEIADALRGNITNTLKANLIYTSAGLRETDLYQWRGLEIQHVRKNFPEEYSTWKQSPHLFRMNRIEKRDSGVIVSSFYPLLEVYKRVRQFWQELLLHNLGKTVLIVAHGGSNRALISTALGIKPERYHCIQQSNCGISVLQFTDASLKSGQLEAMNLNSHMGHIIPTIQEGAGGIRLLLVASETTIEKKHNLISSLRDTPLDFSIVDTSNNSYYIAKQILQYYPAIPQMSVIPSEFVAFCEETTSKKLKMTPENKLFNGLVVAELGTIKQLIGKILGMNSQQVEKLNVQLGTISAIHYPGFELPPVLQAINASGREKDLIYPPEFLQSNFCDK